MSAELDGRIVLVTGAGRGLGRAVAAAAARAGGTVVASGRTRRSLESLDDELRAESLQATLLPLDLTDDAKLLPLGPSIYQRFGRLDALVHCAAVLGPLTPTAQLEGERLRQAVAVNLFATQGLIATLDPLLRAAPAARALFVTDRLAARGRPYLAAYAASKQAMEALVLAYAAETAQTPLEVRLVAPPPMRTRLRTAAYPGETKEKQADPAEIALRIVRALAADSLPEVELIEL